MERNLPHHLIAEQSVLGVILLDPSKISQVLDKLRIDDFFDLRHQMIYKAMIAANNENLVIDLATVIAKLEQAKELGKAGGGEYILDLLNLVPSTSFIDDHIDLVIDGSLKRQLIDVSSKILKAGYEDNIEANQYISKAEEMIFAVSQKRRTTEFTSLYSIVEELKHKMEQNKENRGGITGLKTGFYYLDRVTSGLQPEELLILAARPSMGKSAFALNLALNIASKNKNEKASVAVFSLEMSNEQLASRMLSVAADIEGNKLKTGNLDSKDWGKLEYGKTMLQKLNIVFDDSAAVSVSDIRAKCRKLSQEGKLDFVVIDYLQLIKGEVKNGNRQEEVAKISRGLKQMARELKVPVLALSQLSRDVEKRDDKRPVLADLRESGSIEQDADIVLFLYRDDYYQRDPSKKTGDVEINIAKNRQGQSGVNLQFKFDPAYSRFTTKEEREEDFSNKG